MKKLIILIVVLLLCAGFSIGNQSVLNLSDKLANEYFINLSDNLSLESGDSQLPENASLVNLSEQVKVSDETINDPVSEEIDLVNDSKGVEIVETSSVTNVLGSDLNIALEQVADRSEFRDYYDPRTVIFKQFQNISESSRESFLTNLKIYESHFRKNLEYAKLRNENIAKSIDPPFNSTFCIEKNAYCNCGDGICASYEDKCRCPQDCGSCSDGQICKWGKCFAFEEGVCMNNVCELDEVETCPWDCK